MAVDSEEVSDEDREFYNIVRDNVVTALLFCVIYTGAAALLSCFRKSNDDTCGEDLADQRVAFGLCAFSAAVSFAAVVLLPFSLLSNEILRSYPNVQYTRWLSDPLLQGLWNKIFVGTYLALFIALPFSYLYLESVGAWFFRQRHLSRIAETSVSLGMAIILLYCLLWVAMDTHPRGTDVVETRFSLHAIYSAVSSIGVLLHLICAPVGFSQLFTVLGEVLVKPQFLRDVTSELNALELQESYLHRTRSSYPSKLVCLDVPSSMVSHTLQEELLLLHLEKSKLEHLHHSSVWTRNFLYPCGLVLLVALMSLSVLLVAKNFLQLLWSEEYLPSRQDAMVLGKVYVSMFGLLGTGTQMLLIFYMMLASLFGVYNLPFLRGLRPALRSSSSTQLIGNCAILLVLSSSLPVVARILGITSFDLLGDYGRIGWLSNGRVLLFYNLLFEVGAAIAFGRKVTSSIGHALLRHFGSAALVRRTFHVIQWHVTVLSQY